jgi:hypothetical protein
MMIGWINAISIPWLKQHFASLAGCWLFWHPAALT